MRRVIALVLSLTVVTAAPKSAVRIVGGSTTTISEYPELVGILFSRNGGAFQHQCGAIILNNRSVLTAAHCTQSYVAQQMRVRAGSTFANSGGIVYDVGLVIDHHEYSSFTMDNDVSILRTISPIAVTDVSRPGRIAGSNYFLADNQVVWAAGWGVTSEGGRPSEQLRHVQIWSVNHDVCNQRYGGSLITDNMLCVGWLDVGGRDQCQNDSGGPLYHNGVVVGVCSFGMRCGDPYFPGVNARVSRYTAWIDANK